MKAERKMSEYNLRSATPSDIPGITELYREVAAIEGGLARTAEEVTDKYIESFVTNSVTTGIIIVAEHPEHKRIIGEIHSYALGPKVFAHVLGELTIAIHPDYQGMGIGKAIFTELIRAVRDTRSDILRVELIARESNAKAIDFYQKLGFEIEGRMTGRIKSVGGGFEADIPMAWRRT